MKRELIRWMSTWPFWLKNIVYTVWLKTTRAGRVANERERLVVSSWDELVGCGEFYHVMHAHRYWWASKRLKGTDILDLGCGAGYGAWYLAHSNLVGVIGYDPDENAISWAKDHFTNEGKLDFITTLHPHDTVSTIVCFEVIEHDPNKVFNDIINHLEIGGTLIISTPNAEPSSIRQWLLDKKKVILNHTHKYEYTAPKLRDLFLPYFDSIELFGQCPKNVRNFYDYEEYRRKRGVLLDDFIMDPNDFVNCEVIVALCRGFLGN